MPNSHNPILLYYITNSKKRKRFIGVILYGDNVESKVYDVSREKVFNLNGIAVFALFYERLLRPVMNSEEVFIASMLYNIGVSIESKSVKGRVYDFIRIVSKKCSVEVDVALRSIVVKPDLSNLLSDDEIIALSVGFTLYLGLLRDYCKLDKTVILYAREKKVAILSHDTGSYREKKVDDWDSVEDEDILSLIHE